MNKFEPYLDIYTKIKCKELLKVKLNTKYLIKSLIKEKIIDNNNFIYLKKFKNEYYYEELFTYFIINNKTELNINYLLNIYIIDSYELNIIIHNGIMSQLFLEKLLNTCNYRITKLLIEKYDSILKDRKTFYYVIQSKNINYDVINLLIDNNCIIDQYYVNLAMIENNYYITKKNLNSYLDYLMLD